MREEDVQLDAPVFGLGLLDAGLQSGGWVTEDDVGACV